MNATIDLKSNTKSSSSDGLDQLSALKPVSFPRDLAIAEISKEKKSSDIKSSCW